MIDIQTMLRLMACFQGSYVNQYGEFVAAPKECKRGADAWFNIARCKDETDIKCKVIEYLSRPAYKSEPYNTKGPNDRFHAFMSYGVNKYLGTEFTYDDFQEMYSRFGNGVNHKLTKAFIKSGYDINVLTQKSN